MSHARWSAARANAWAAARPWYVGCNFLPSTAINQIEMFAADSFDAMTIDRELGWAAALGFNAVRVYLHDLLWTEDAEGFLGRLDAFLHIADRHGIAALVVLFDDCWHEPRAGRQPDPVPGVHNSGWARSPGRDTLLDRGRWPVLEAYVTAVVRRFADDRRIIGWDVYNECTNIYMPAMALPRAERKLAMAELMRDRPAQSDAAIALLHAAFGWVRTVDPSQPLTAGSWHEDEGLNATLHGLSDIISFHNYKPVETLEAELARLKAFGRPLWCTEYLNRRENCLFETHLPLFHRERVGCWNWGLVDGRSQTKYAWSDPAGGPEPDPWFHDILHANGAPYRDDEAAFLKATLRRP
ncbi:glycoside hydrolase family 5 protein [Sandaracinobacteroides saxicola]|uniref:Cellulase family glycosylhydrolase n=1 Tax=Sandaracinobacteroides saxicola TaxID=2759707 RepID=A0A7G5IGB6_9SPHN|nr:cellulase family glycosylhydrolase [Sandaracinobacteroides saxicola]QMW22408.1 cellulase family glycosylhydrolase [Sandaracinobacteroides saxicola]